MLPYVKEIFDPIYGFIKLTRNEINVVDNLIFQRLHNINQLGTLHMVFPTARNTRFSHSLGVLAITSRIIDNLKRLPNQESKVVEKYEMPPNDQKLIRMAALLHDIGHLPFSHCTERVIRDYLREKYPQLDINDEFHEWLGGEIIKKTDIYSPEDKDLEEILQDRSDISQIIQGSSKFYLCNQILNSELDADRLDYLLRDSYSIGVSFGQVDLAQTLRKMFVEDREYERRPLSDKIIVYSTSAINAIDNYYFARMFMYNTVYYHKTSCYFDDLLSKAYHIIINSENEDLEELEGLLPLRPDEILAPILEGGLLDREECKDFFNKWHGFDDHYLWNSLRRCWQRLKKIPNDDLNQKLQVLKKILTLLYKRKRSELVWERNFLKNEIEKTRAHSDTPSESLVQVFKDLEKWIKNELSQDTDAPLLIVLNHRIPAPLSNIKNEDPEELKDYIGKYTLFYNSEEEKFHYLHNVKSSINYRLNKTGFHIFRVFCPERELKEELNNKIGTKYNELIETLSQE